jgi:hypothetical protein
MVYVMVPDVAPERDVVTAARVAQRLAFQKGLMPIYPPLYCFPFLAPEEMDKDLGRVAAWWLRRVSRMWVAFPGDPEDWRLDPASFELLHANESPHRQRLPVSILHQHSEGVVPVALRREDVDTLLMENATAGLSLAGGAAS